MDIGHRTRIDSWISYRTRIDIGYRTRMDIGVRTRIGSWISYRTRMELDMKTVHGNEHRCVRRFRYSISAWTLTTAAPSTVRYYQSDGYHIERELMFDRNRVRWDTAPINDNHIAARYPCTHQREFVASDVPYIIS